MRYTRSMASRRAVDEQERAPHERLLAIDWGGLSPLRLRAKAIAAGNYAGMHRSRRRGPGIEFGGQRPYVPGDDLRFIDRRSLLRHDRLMIREFETETDRALWLVLDASRSMAFFGSGEEAKRQALGAKLAYAAVMAAALGRIATASHDPVGLRWLGDNALRDLPPAFGPLAYERLVAVLEQARADALLQHDGKRVERLVQGLANRAKRGSVVVVFSDLLDLPERAQDAFAALGTRGRALVVVQVLDPVELELSFRGKVRLRAMEGQAEVVTDADAVRADYQERLAALSQGWRARVEAVGGRLLLCDSSRDPALAVREVLQAIAEARP